MSLTYQKISKKPQLFLRLTGVTLAEFAQLCTQVKPLWEAKIEATKKRHGRTSGLKTFEDKLLALLLYYLTRVMN